MSTSATLSSPRSSFAASLACRFCEKLAEVHSEQAEWAVVAESKHLVGVPSIGPLVPGWLLILPRDHHLNFAEAIEQNREIASELATLAEQWEELYGPLTWFEHGPKEDGTDVGCSIDHAHMHLVPLGDLNLVAAAEKHFVGIRFSPIGSLNDLVEAVSEDRSYLYVRLPDGTQSLAASNSIPSQALRRVIASEQGRPEQWDWKQLVGRDLLAETIARATQPR